MVSSCAVRPLSTSTLNFAFAFVDFGSAGATAFFLEAPRAHIFFARGAGVFTLPLIRVCYLVFDRGGADSRAERPGAYHETDARTASNQ